MAFSGRACALCSVICCFSIVSYIAILGLAISLGTSWKRGGTAAEPYMHVWNMGPPKLPYTVSLGNATTSDGRFGLFYAYGQVDSITDSAAISCNASLFQALPTLKCVSHSHSCSRAPNATANRYRYTGSWLCSTESFLELAGCPSESKDKVNVIRGTYIGAIVIIIVGHCLIFILSCIAHRGSVATKVIWLIVSVVLLLGFVVAAILATIGFNNGSVWAKNPCNNGNEIAKQWGEAYYLGIVGVVACWVLVLVLIILIIASFPWTSRNKEDIYY